jgi:arylformamidase
MEMTIDYEKEYNNRARVPEHVQIFADWLRDSAVFCETCGKERNGAELGLSYGPSPRQTLNIFPAKGDTGSAPLAVFIHGGWWRSLSPESFNHMAKGPNAQGVSVAVVGYDLCPQVSIATIVEQMRNACLFLWKRRRQRMTVYGHSAGGHLTACLTGTNWKTLSADVPDDLVPAGYAISGVFDLAPLIQISINQDLKLDAAEALRLSPISWTVPGGRTLDAVVGALESDEFLRQSRTIADAWRNHAQTRYEAIAGTNHYTVIDPLADPDSDMTKRVTELARQTAGMKL